MTEVEAKLESEVTEENQFTVSMMGLASGEYDTGEETYDVTVDHAGSYLKVYFKDEEGEKVGGDNVLFDIDDLCYAAAEKLDL